jgi:asparagine synthase (glutamine-hydrolysing)
VQIFAVVCRSEPAHDVGVDIAGAVTAAARPFPGLRRVAVTHGESRSGRIGFAALSTPPDVAEPRRYVARSDETVVLFDGFPVEREGRFPAHDAAELMQHWDRLGDSLEGLFSAVRVDLSSDSVECLTDVIGLAKLFFLRRAGGWLLSNSVEAIRAVSGASAPDPVGVSALLTLGWPANRSLIHAIRPLEPGHRHRLTSARTEAKPVLTPGMLAPGNETGAPRDVEELAVLLSRSASAAVEAARPLVCPLTAGRDSRVLLALMLAIGAEPDSYYTTGEPGELDVEIARSIAAEVGVPYEVLTPELPGSADEWVEATARFVSQTDGMATLYGISDHVDRPQPVDRLGLKVWGVGGEIAALGRIDVLIPFAATVPGLRLSWDVQRKVMESKVSTHGGVVRDAAAEAVRSYLRDFVHARREEGWHARDVLEAYYAFERVRNWASTGLRRMAGATDLYSPFLSRDYVRFAFSRSHGERFVEATQYGMLSVLRPELRDIAGKEPWHPQHPRLAPLLACGLVGRAVVGRVAGRVLRRERPLFERVVHGYEAVPFGQRWFEAGIGAHRELCASVPDSPLWEFLDRKRLESALAAPPSARGRWAPGLSAAMTALWYFHGRGESAAQPAG